MMPVTTSKDLTIHWSGKVLTDTKLVELIKEHGLKTKNFHTLILKGHKPAHIDIGGLSRSERFERYRSNLSDVLGMTYRNSLGDDAAFALAELITANPHVRCLDLRDLMITRKGFDALCKAACENQNLVELKLSGNPIAVPIGFNLDNISDLRSTELRQDAGLSAEPLTFN